MFSPKWIIGFFLKLSMKLGCLKGRNWRSWIFGKISHFGDNAQKYPQNRFFLDFAKKKKKNLLMCRFFEFKSCTIITFMILLKPLEKLVLKSNAKMLWANQIAWFLNFNISKTTGDKKLIFFASRYISIKTTNWCCDFRWAWSVMPRHVQRGYWNFNI